MSGRLTTHVLDTAHGRPAGGVLIELWRIDSREEGESRTLLHTDRTNEDGRTARPLLAGDGFHAGTYELVFLIGQYFSDLGAANADILFLDRVPVRFGISDPDAHYHVPLLSSPWAYSTYRGS
jgi:5-hydroxyisourate hydrolase